MPGEAITQLLHALEAGQHDAFEQLLAEVYDELRVLARAQLRNERAGHTLNTTSLVHEAYLKLVEHREKNWTNRAHFFGVAATAMRRILVDYARSRDTHKRRGEKVGLTQAEALEEVSLHELLEIDDALAGMQAMNPRWVRVVECRFFAGLSIKETAAALGISTSTVTDDWRMARAWLKVELGAGSSNE